MSTVLDTSKEEQKGTSYIRWGRKTCESNATLVYKGWPASLLHLKGPYQSINQSINHLFVQNTINTGLDTGAHKDMFLQQ